MASNFQMEISGYAGDVDSDHLIVVWTDGVNEHFGVYQRIDTKETLSEANELLKLKKKSRAG